MDEYGKENITTVPIIIIDVLDKYKFTTNNRTPLDDSVENIEQEHEKTQNDSIVHILI